MPTFLTWLSHEPNSFGAPIVFSATDGKHADLLQTTFGTIICALKHTVVSAKNLDRVFGWEMMPVSGEQ
jgi:hypothetical protein